MNQQTSVPLNAVELQTLENNLRARRGASLLVVGAESPMETFQEDLRECAQRLGFQPKGSGRFIVSRSPDDCAELRWEPAAAPTIH